ncbi:helix-turn-helix domain-containing protein [Tenacibaculum amylolyticum]|uniref:helix-turn-helix domain-containing protein n=1 Tax=Tenacibaculum amylolyticum TaxID=104269 RepID=UPI003892F1AA
MKIRAIKPNNVLEKYIDFYYELALHNDQYYAYPSANNVVCIFNKAATSYVDDEIKINACTNASNTFMVLNKFTTPLFVNNQGYVKEFVIIFKPYGLAQFTNTCNDSLFFELTEFNDFLSNNSCFFERSENEKVDLIETYLLTKLNEKEGLDIVMHSISLMKNDQLSLQDIATACNCSYKKLYRLFVTHCGTSPIVIRKNNRFRNALEKIKNQDEGSKLSDVAFDLGYYDQAFFNKMFKDKTGNNPKQFFKDVSILSKKDIYFKKK